MLDLTSALFLVAIFALLVVNSKAWMKKLLDSCRSMITVVTAQLLICELLILLLNSWPSSLSSDNISSANVLKAVSVCSKSVEVLLLGGLPRNSLCFSSGSLTLPTETTLIEVTEWMKHAKDSKLTQKHFNGWRFRRHDNVISCWAFSVIIPLQWVLYCNVSFVLHLYWQRSFN